MADTWRELRLGWLNVGTAPAAGVVAALDDNGIDIGGLAECSDRRDVYDHMADAFDLFAPGLPGGLATPVFWRPARFTDPRADSPELHPAADMGAGTGPDNTKTKRLNKVSTQDRTTGRHIVFGTGHWYTSQRWAGPIGNKRARASRDMTRKAVTILDQSAGIPFLGVDGNAGASSRTWRPAWQAGWTSNHRLNGHPLITHPKTHGSIDAILGRPDDRWRFQRTYAVRVGSDHLLTVMVVELLARKRWAS